MLIFMMSKIINKQFEKGKNTGSLRLSIFIVIDHGNNENLLLRLINLKLLNFL